MTCRTPTTSPSLAACDSRCEKKKMMSVTVIAATLLLQSLGNALNSCEQVANSSCQLPNGVFPLTPISSTGSQPVFCNLSTGFTPVLEFNAFAMTSVDVCGSLSPDLKLTAAGCAIEATRFQVCANFTVNTTFAFSEVKIEPEITASGTIDGFSSSMLVDGLAIVAADTDEIVWVFAATNDAPEVPGEWCPCDSLFAFNRSILGKEFVLTHDRYWCEAIPRTVSTNIYQVFNTNSTQRQCAPKLAPIASSVTVSLMSPSRSIRGMLCRDQAASNENVYLRSLRLSVRETTSWARPPCPATVEPDTRATLTTTTSSSTTSSTSSSTLASTTLAVRSESPVPETTISNSSFPGSDFVINSPNVSEFSLGIIVGVAVSGGMMLLLGVIAGIWACRRRRAKATNAKPESVSVSSSSKEAPSSSEYSNIPIEFRTSEYEVGNLQTVG